MGRFSMSTQPTNLRPTTPVASATSYSGWFGGAARKVGSGPRRCHFAYYKVCVCMCVRVCVFMSINVSGCMYERVHECVK